MSANGGNDLEPPGKMAKIQPETEPFYLIRNPVILNEVKDRKTLFLHGKVGPDEEDAVAILEKKPFDTSPESLASIFSEETKLKQDIKNDIYGTYSATPTMAHAAIKATMIFPATQKHIDKYRKQEVVVIEETANDYENITLPFLENQNRFSHQWVFNILDKKTESERIVFEDPDFENGFILLPDMKWDIKDVSSLYLIAIIHKRTIKSLRDLKTEHLPLLKNILHQGQKAILDKYGIGKDKLRIYLHYQPSYYHLHVHFTHIDFDAPGTTVTRAHLLSDVIENIEMIGDYYQRKTMTFVGRKDDKLTAALSKNLS